MTGKGVYVFVLEIIGWMTNPYPVHPGWKGRLIVK